MPDAEDVIGDEPTPASRSTAIVEVKEKQTGVGRGKWKRPEKKEKSLRGYAAIKARSDLEMRMFVPDEEEERMIEEVAREVIHKGRPPKYNEDYEDASKDMPTRIFNLISDTSKGMRTIDGCAALLGIVDDTFRDWQRKHDRFSSAVKMGKMVQEMKAARRMSNGVAYPTSLIFTMKNLHNWADRLETAVSFNLIDALQKYGGDSVQVDWDRPAMPQKYIETSLISEGAVGQHGHEQDAA